MSKAVIYARVSSKEQEQEGYSIPSQLRLLNEYAISQGYKVIEEFIDIETAKQSGREKFGLMLKFIENHVDTRTILCEKTDRLSRNLYDIGIIKNLIERNGLKLILVKENKILNRDSSTGDHVQFGLMAVIAESYIINLRAETRKGMLEKAEQGIYPSCAPLGYKNVENKTQGKTLKYLEPDELKAPILKQVFMKYAAGEGSIELLVKWAYENGLRNRGGGLVGKAALHKILHSPVYCGMFQWKGKIYQGKHTPVVSKELFNMVQKRFDDQNRPRQSKRHFAYTGLIYCEKCGCSITAELKKDRYVYYHCTEFHGKCGVPWMREEVLDTKLAEIVSMIRVDSDLIELIKATLLSSHKDEIEFHQKAISALLAQKTKLEHRIHQVYRDKLDDKITEDFYNKLRGECQQELDQIKEQISRHESADDNYLEQGVRIIELCNRLNDLYLNQTPIERGKLLRFVLSNCTWDGVTLCPKWRKPFDLMAKGLSRSNWLPDANECINWAYSEDAGILTDLAKELVLV